MELKLTAWRCDGCEKVVLPRVTDDEAPAVGFHGTVTVVPAEGEVASRSWYAHTTKCIGKAIKNVCWDE